MLTTREMAIAISNQGLFTAKPRESQAVCALRVNPLTSTYPAISAHAEPISEGHCQGKQKVSQCIYASLVVKVFISNSDDELGPLIGHNLNWSS